MRKWTYFFFVLIGLFVISGCSGVDENEKREKLKKTVMSLEKQLQKSIDALKSDENVVKYLSDVQYEKTEDSDDVNLYYNIVGKLNDSFDSLSRKEQYDFFARITDIIRGMYKDNNGKLSCDSNDYLCEIWSVELATSKEKYTMLYKDKIDYKLDKSEQTLRVGNSLEYGSNGYPVPDEEDTTDSDIGNSTPSTNLSTADGDDWMQMSSSQKSEMVSTVLSNLKRKGYTISEGSTWFVDALDAFYGDKSTNSTKVTEAIVMAGVGGQVIIKP
ncbi:hypothetical protein [Bacillus sp. KbaB1]|uniref:hypothetical protein n=1 Tax=Bacillus sp. KbaB1 TaxID=1972845 RepID=UPI000B7C6DFC|nr:hypothetical protein [Bacillus sp. KbaB1]OXL97088.1 hypothetical protein B6N65_17530 [Bacillus sp. KbaB1]